MVDSDKTWLGAVLAKKERENCIVEILSMQTEPATKVGENYQSLILRATVKVVLGSGITTTKRFIIKKMLENVPRATREHLTEAFTVECLAYDKILAVLETMIQETCLPFSKFWPECYFNSNHQMVFEDLRASGFILSSRQKGLDLPHAELVFTYLARLHSLSLVALENGTISKKTMPTYLIIEPGLADIFYRVSMKSLADVIHHLWGPEWSAVEKKLRCLMNETVPILSKLYREPHKLDVINHGDSWVNNMMFKYDSNKSPVELKLVDLQLCHCNSYAWDLTYFLHTSINPKNLESWQNKLIDIYSKEFAQNLARLDFDISIAPSADDIREELLRLQPFAIAVSSSFLPVTANPSDMKIGIEELLNNENTKFRELFEHKEFDTTIKTMMKYLVKTGAFSKIN